MGSLVPGWDSAKVEPDFRERGKVQEAEVPKWLQRVRSTDPDDRDAKLHHACDAAQRGLARHSLTRKSMGSPKFGSPSSLGYLSTDAPKRFSLQLKRDSASAAAADSAPASAPPAAEEHINWWEKVEHSFANEKLAAELADGEYKTGNYVPQHDVAQQHHHHDDAAEQHRHDVAEQHRHDVAVHHVKESA